MAVFKQPRSSNWSYEFNCNGQRVRKSTKQSNRRVAEQMEAAHKTQLAVDRDNRGCSTPAEEFASGVLSYWRPGSPPLTPLAAERMLAEVRQNFDDMRDDSRAFLSRYPEAVEVA